MIGFTVGLMIGVLFYLFKIEEVKRKGRIIESWKERYNDLEEEWKERFNKLKYSQDKKFQLEFKLDSIENREGYRILTYYRKFSNSFLEYKLHTSINEKINGEIELDLFEELIKNK